MNEIYRVKEHWLTNGCICKEGSGYVYWDEYGGKCWRCINCFGRLTSVEEIALNSKVVPPEIKNQ